MLSRRIKLILLGLMAAAFLFSVSAQNPSQQKDTSYLPVDIKEPFATTMARMKAAKAGVMQRQMALLNERYDLSIRVSDGVKMTRGKLIPVGPATRLGSGLTWETLGAMSPDEIRERGLFPKGFLPLPHPNHPEGGMVFPKMMIDELIKMGEGNRL